MKSYAKRCILIIIFSLVVVVALLKIVDFSELKAALFKANLWLLGIAFLKTPAVIILWTIRWREILKARQLKPRFKNSCIAILISSLVNNLTPGFRAGGEPVRAYIIHKREGISMNEAFASILARYILEGMIAPIVGMTVFCLVFFTVELPPLAIKILLPLLLGLFAFVLSAFYLVTFRFLFLRKIALFCLLKLSRFSHRIDRWTATFDKSLTLFHENYQFFVKNRRTICVVLILSVANWMLDVLQPCLIFWALLAKVPLYLVMVNYIIVRIAGMFAFIPGGAGVVEMANFGLYIKTTSYASGIIAAETILHRALDAWSVSILGAITLVVTGSSEVVNYPS